MAAFLLAIRIGAATAAFALVCHEIYRCWRNRKVEHVPCPEELGTTHVAKCLLCLCEFDSFTTNQKLDLPCNHVFHKDCLLEVFRNEEKGKRICPCCRRGVSENFISNSISSYKFD